jgi:hypothetical protein
VGKKDQKMEILEAVAHPVRKGVVSSLTYGQRTFSNLMLDCGLDPGSETGLFLYHLSKLMEDGFVKKENGRYRLTKVGEEASRLLQSIPNLSAYPRIVEGGEKTVSKISIPKISVEEVVGGNMIIDQWEFKPSEKRIYKETGRISSDIFGGSFYIKECLGTVNLPSETGKAFMVRHESYTRNYFGTEKNRIRTPIKDGYHLSMREYDVYSLREDSVYLLWTSVWGPNYETEKPDETIYDPSEKMMEPPMKVGDEASYEKKESDYLHKVHSRVLGQYKVTINDRIFDCLLKRTHSAWTKDSMIEIDRIGERYVNHGTVDILTRAYHAPTQKRRWMFESVKGWEKNPIVECCGEKHYLTSESFLAKRTC